MVAGLPRKSRNATSSSNHHFMPTRPLKDQPSDLRLPDFPEDFSKNSRKSLALRPKNVASGKAVTSMSNPKPQTIGKPSNVGAKRRTAMPDNNCASDKPTPFASPPSDRVLINEAKRRYVLRPQIGYSANSINMMLTSNYTSEDSNNCYSPDEQVVSGILDGITSLCLGPTSYPHSYHPGVSSVRIGSYNNGRNMPRPSSPSQQQRRKKKVVYPIASYPARLNCQKLISERRAVFQQNLFRPVSSDEMSHYQSSVRAS
jgi:hypothetical protein